MTKSQYLEMCEQMNQDPDWEKCPPDVEDFPHIIIDTINLFNCMGDRIYPDIGYIGKDFTNFNFLLKKFTVEKHQEDFVFEIILFLDSRAIKASQDKAADSQKKLSKQ